MLQIILFACFFLHLKIINNCCIAYFKIKFTFVKFLKKKIYLSLDVDVLDPAYAPGTSNPEPFGLSSFDVLKIIEEFASVLVGFDIVEVCPFFDKGETAIISAKYIKFVIENVWLNKVF